MTGTGQSKLWALVRKILFLLALLSSPFLCFGFSLLLEFIPPSLLPPALDIGINLFETTVTVENKSGETLYITPIDINAGQPEVLLQVKSLRQRDIPVKPNHSIVVEYDEESADLSGIVVCREIGECRLLPANGADVYYLETFDNLTEIEPGWLETIRAHPQYNFTTTIALVLFLMPIVLFLSWLYMGRFEKARTG